MKNALLHENLDFSISFCRDKKENAGEDALFSQVSDNYAAICAFDGCGGLGAKTYPSFGGKTGAYMASRLVSGATQGWFSTLSPERLCSEEYLKFIDFAYGVVSRHAGSSGPVIKGSMASKSFPTTIATAIVSKGEDGLYADFFWAGDSRGYILDENGLHQITKDDINGEDAMSNLTNDGVMTNVAHSGGKYTLHSKKVKLSTPCLVFCATDGCFGYLSTPMEFEHLILSCLIHSDTPITWEKQLDEKFGFYAGDDYTFSLISAGFGDFSALKRYFYQRVGQLESDYINKLEGLSVEQKTELWNEYKKDYYSISPEANCFG